MTEEKKISDEKLTDEELDKVAGGAKYIPPGFSPTKSSFDDQINVNGQNQTNTQRFIPI